LRAAQAFATDHTTGGGRHYRRTSRLAATWWLSCAIAAARRCGRLSCLAVFELARMSTAPLSAKLVVRAFLPPSRLAELLLGARVSLGSSVSAQRRQTASGIISGSQSPTRLLTFGHRRHHDRESAMSIPNGTVRITSPSDFGAVVTMPEGAGGRHTPCFRMGCADHRHIVPTSDSGNNIEPHRHRSHGLARDDNVEVHRGCVSAMSTKSAQQSIGCPAAHGRANSAIQIVAARLGGRYRHR